MSFKIAALIPCYNHGATVQSVVATLRELALEVLVVDDGSDSETQQHLAKVSQIEQVNCLRLNQNQGKGGAVMAGMQALYNQGYSHVIQVDADGQHDLNQIQPLIHLAKQQPTAVISGCPIYDNNVPKARLYGRYATHCSVWLETLSFEIKDAMCGFRVYPLQACWQLMQQHSLGKRMDFDIEILVRLYWQGLSIVQLPIKVIYPEDGLSHFKALDDNLKISWLHTRLIASMLPRAPKLIWRNIRANTNQQHWSKTSETGTRFGIKTMLNVYRWFGRRPFEWLLHPVMAYYYCSSASARRASRGYLARIQQQQANLGLERASLSSYRHFYSFGLTILDKMASWQGDIRREHITLKGEQLLISTMAQQQGCVILGSHLGNLELCRALSSQYTDLKINALVFTQHAEKFNRILGEVNPNSHLNLIQVSEMGPDTAMLLEQKLQQGEWVVIVGDRTSVTRQKRVIWSDFLGHSAPFPQGPFVLAAILKHPCYLMFGFPNDTGYDIHFELFSEQPNLPRKDRQQALQSYVDQYAKRLEHFALMHPLQWFNFFDFWTLDNDG
ncbi:glycosyltransferase family 2 protein [Agarivorans sp. QJM3NY_33]|uniref:glycosyltransferase family 2 protein n=1 Tax=Agarivorans sp. QJM3NY_33 TaxID=3421432 RepID=UPI003D7D9901